MNIIKLKSFINKIFICSMDFSNCMITSINKNLKDFGSNIQKLPETLSSPFEELFFVELMWSALSCMYETLQGGNVLDLNVISH